MKGKNEVRRKVLVPLARSEMDKAIAAGRPGDETLIEEVAATVYKRHRHNPKSRVQERIFANIPNSEKGKYRKIAREALTRVQAQAKRV